MADRIQKEDLIRRLAARMHTDEATATAWVDGFVETLYDSFKAGESVTIQGFGGFYLLLRTPHISLNCLHCHCNKSFFSTVFRAIAVLLRRSPGDIINASYKRSAISCVFLGSLTLSTPSFNSSWAPAFAERTSIPCSMMEAAS